MILNSNQEFNKYDDPQTVCSNLLVLAKKAGMDLEFPANKLIIGYGDYVCIFLFKILDKHFKLKKFVFASPVHHKGGDELIEE